MASSYRLSRRAESAELPLGEWYALVVKCALAMDASSKRIPYGKVPEIVAQFGVSTKTVNVWWSKAMEQIDRSVKVRKAMSPDASQEISVGRCQYRKLGAVRLITHEMENMGIGVSKTSVFR